MVADLMCKSVRSRPTVQLCKGQRGVGMRSKEPRQLQSRNGTSSYSLNGVPPFNAHAAVYSSTTRRIKMRAGMAAQP